LARVVAVLPGGLLDVKYAVNGNWRITPNVEPTHVTLIEKVGGSSSSGFVWMCVDGCC
jgi:hypothetical protein